MRVNVSDFRSVGRRMSGFFVDRLSLFNHDGSPKETPPMNIAILVATLYLLFTVLYGAGHERAERLAVQLRALGIEPKP
jgi:hypothetical protein